MPVVPLPPAGRLLRAAPSPGERGWGGSSALLNLGAGEAALAALTGAIGRGGGAAAAPRRGQRLRSARARHRRGSLRNRRPRAFAADAGAASSRGCTATCWRSSRRRPGSRGPRIRRSSSRRRRGRWRGAGTRPSARLLRAARGAPEAAGLGLVVQEMALALGPGASGAGLSAARRQPHRRRRRERRLPAAAPARRGRHRAGRAALEALPARTRDAAVGGRPPGDRRARRRGAH